MKRIAITGAHGFVGSMLARRFEDAGWSVTRLSHSSNAGDGDTVAFRLGDEISPDVFRSRSITAVVHCAYDFKPLARAEIQRVNVDGSRKLLASAAMGGVKRIAVMSTISAFEGSRSVYGKAKLEIEAAALAAGALVVRSGLVWADGPPSGGGMFGSLSRSVNGGLVPLVGEAGIRSTWSTCRTSGSCCAGSAMANFKRPRSLLSRRPRSRGRCESCSRSWPGARAHIPGSWRGHGRQSWRGFPLPGFPTSPRPTQT